MIAKRILMFAVAMLFVGITYTNVKAECSTRLCAGYIERLYFDSAGTLFIATDGDESNLNCTSPLSVYVTIPPTDEQFNRKYAMLLTAFTMEKPVTIRINTGSNGCTVNYVFMDKEIATP